MFLFLHCVGFFFFAAPPRSSSSSAFAFRLPPSSSLLQHLSHNISHNNITQTTSHTQRLAYNITPHNISHNNISRTTAHTHTTSLTQHRMPRGRMCASLLQHLSQQHHSENIPHTTSHTQQHTHNMTHTTSPTRPHRRRFRGRRSTLLLVKGSDVRPSVASSLCIWFHTPQMDCPCSQLCCL